MALSFRGGLCLDGQKITAREPIITMAAPDVVTLPLLQHKGEPCIPLVKEGDLVLKGQRIAVCEDGDAPLHASVSGRILAIQKALTTLGETDAFLIENDHKDALSPEIRPFHKPISKAEPEELITHIREKGIVGMGGKAFPTWRKIEAARGKTKTLIINCTESEPYLTSDHRILLEKTEEVVGGVKILLRATGCEKAIFAIENNKEDAVEAVGRIVAGSPSFAIAVFRSKYPQGDEKNLIRAMMNKEVKEGTLPMDMGVVTFNAETCWDIYRAFVGGLPVIERLVTVSGDCVKAPANLMVPLGTSFHQVLQFCGGLFTTPDRILSGGPMMGEAISDENIPVTKCVGAILALKAPKETASPCFRCGRCVRACPLRLMPLELYQAVKTQNHPKAALYHIDSCNECGLCTYACPSRIPLLEVIRGGKADLAAKEEGGTNG